MAKNSRKRKRERAKREARAAQKRRAAGYQQEAEEFVRTVLERYDRIVNPATPPGEVASLIAQQYGGEPVNSLLADKMLSEGSSPERLTEIAGTLLAADSDDTGDGASSDDTGDGASSDDTGDTGDAVGSGDTADGTLLAGGDGRESSPSLTALTFAASAARVTGDAGAARKLLDQALAVASDPQTGDPEERTELALHLSVSGRDADGIELLEARLREEPDDLDAAERYGAMLDLVHARVHGEAPADCPCGQGRPWQECCGTRERAALARFEDRTGLNALQEAVRAYAADSGFGPAVGEQVAEWLSLTDELDGEPAEQDRFAALAEEAAWLMAGPAGKGEAGPAGKGEEGEDGDDADEVGNGDDEDEDRASGVMSAFAADPSVPAELARRAAAWREHIHYGLWRVDDEPRAAPGLWCTEIVSCVTRYAEFPAEVTDGPPRWAVWLGGLVPVDGIWRCTGHGFWLSPAEADAAAELVHEAWQGIAAELTGARKRRRTRLMTEPMRFGRAEPLGVYADGDDPAPGYMVSLLSEVTGALLSRIAAEVLAYRCAPPGLRNTDGDEMCLITARIKVDDGEQAAERLARRTDFDRDPAEPGRVIWYGRPVPDAQRATMLAEVTARLSAQEHPAADFQEPAGPQRWIRGTLDVRGNELVAEVNSRERLARLLEILARTGASPVITDETRVDPAQDTGWPAGQRAFPGGAAPAAEGWEKHWLEEKVPALRGRTPRQAARGKERPLLEALLRQSEYEADLLAAQGEHGIDTAWLRQELGMADYLNR